MYRPSISTDLDRIYGETLPRGRFHLLDSFANLDKVADYCEDNFERSLDKRAALEESKRYVTQSLASVAYQINTLASTFSHALDMQARHLSEMEKQTIHIEQTLSIHQEKVDRREIGCLTSNRTAPRRRYKIIAPISVEGPQVYERKPVDYTVLDKVGHGVPAKPPVKAKPKRVTLPPPTSAGIYGTKYGTIMRKGTPSNTNATKPNYTAPFSYLPSKLH